MLLDFLRRCGLETENLGGVTWVVHVPGSWPVASFASLFRWAVAFVEGGFPMRRPIEVVVNLLMAGLASFRTGIPGRRRGSFRVGGKWCSSGRGGCRRNASRLLRMRKAAE